MMENLTIEDLESLASAIPSHGILVQTLQNLANIDFESVEVVGEDVEYLN